MHFIASSLGSGARSGAMRCTLGEECNEFRAPCFCAPQLEPKVLTSASRIASSTNFVKRRRLLQTKVVSVPHTGLQCYRLRVAPVMEAQNMSPVPRQGKPPESDIFWLSVSAEVLLGITGVALCILSKESILGPGFLVKPSLFGGAILATIPLCGFSWAVGKANSQVREITVAYCREIFLRRSVGEIALFCACVALGEELFFRSWLLQLSMRIFGGVQGQVGSSLLFGLCHGQSATLIAASGLSGYFFSWLFIGCGNSVALPALVHFMYNLISILAFKWEILREESG